MGLQRFVICLLFQKSLSLSTEEAASEAGEKVPAQSKPNKK